ncbi:hypothetical protein FOMA001_g6075 [Fusarium oxysporum f. sp. matthiolae]|nr:hypothetical protein FOMA001_g6075 [Fusarium oxysporum f. sp. matthiolae]
MSTTCGHSSTYVDCSRAAANAGFVRPSPEERTLAMAKTGRLARGAYLSKEDAADNEYSFPGPLVLSGDHLTEQPEEQGQTFKDWFEMEATQQRNGIISRRNKLYVVRPPSMTRPSEEMRDWNKPVLPPDSPPGTERWNSTLKMFKQLIVYLRAFYNTMQITQYPKKISFLPIEQRKRVHFVDTPRTQVIGLKTRDRRKPFEIRYRPSPDGVSKIQLNVSDLRDAPMRSVPSTVHSFVMIVDHDMYEDGEGAYVTARAWASDGVAIVSMFRYNPSLDGLAGIDPLHRWPASHCKANVDERFRVLNKTKGWKKRNRFSSKAFGKPPVKSALDLAIQAATQAGQPSTREELSNQWFARVVFAVSREATHCFGLGNCTYYSCLMQGVSGIRQTGEIPPYLCQVCYSKLGWELVLLQHGFEGGIEREKTWLEAQYAALKAFCNKWNKIPQFAAFVAWLEKRLEDRKGDNDDAAWPSNQEASVIDWPKTIRDMVDIHREPAYNSGNQRKPPDTPGNNVEPIDQHSFTSKKILHQKFFIPTSSSGILLATVISTGSGFGFGADVVLPTPLCLYSPPVSPYKSSLSNLDISNSAPNIFKMVRKSLAVLATVAGASGFTLGPFGTQKPIGQNEHDFKCDLPPVLSPGNDGLPSASELFDSKDAFNKQVKRHQAIVRVPSICYDDLGDVDKDERWAPFYDLHDVLAKTYPVIHKYAKLEKINKFGLVYTFTGSDASLKPYLLAAHQDVVPVPDPSTWTHPPFDAYFDGEWLWGRGASDDKNSLTALMSAIETLLTETKWQPKRTVILAFGFDEECSGPRGAAKIGEFLTERYGDNGIPFILDEGGSGIQLIDDTLYVLPSVQEKGAIDIWAELRVKGGHSSIPHPHTGIGIMAEIISALESKPYEPAILKGSPVYNHLVCLARHSPDSHTKLHDLLKKDDLEKLKDELLHLDPMAKFTIQTTQAVDIIRGGQKINAMPEVVSLGVNYRVAPQDSLDKVQEQFVKNIDAVVQKYNLTLSAYEDDAKSQNIKPGFDYDGHLKLTAFRNSVTTPVSPTSGPIWDIFSGTIQHSFAFDGGKVVPVGEIMTGNTDTRHYLNLSPNIYRWTPSRQRGSENIHTVDERIRIESHVDIVKFYYDLIRNFDAADF